MDANLELKYQKSKYVLKKWESEFRKTNDKLPTKNDIKCAPIKIKEAYKIYWTLKKRSNNDLSQKAATHILEDENAKDCFNSSSEIADISFKEVTDLTKSNSMLEDSVCFQAVTDTVMDSNLNSRLQVENSQDDLNKCDYSNEPNGAKINNSSELTPTSFKNLFNKENRSSLNEPLLIEKSSTLETHSDQKKSNKALAVQSLSFKYAEKLYVGSKFNKRNPRKPTSFNSTKKSSHNLKHNQLVMMNSQSTANNPITTTVTSELNDIPVENFNPNNSSSCVLIKEIKDYTPLLGLDDKFKITTSTPVIATQAVSLLQRSFDNSNIGKLIVSRSVDKGWLERITESNITTNLAESQDSGISSIKTDSLFDPVSNSALSECKTLSTDDDCNEDLIYDSDCETQNRSLHRLNLLDKLNVSRSNTPDTLMKQEKSDILTLESFMAHTENHAGQSAENHAGDISKLNEKKEATNNVKKRCLYSDEVDDLPLSKRLKFDQDCSFSSTTKPEIIIANSNFKYKSKTKNESASDHHKLENLEKKMVSGEANKNFVKINIEKKRYVRGKKTITFSKFKKKKWNEMRKSNLNNSMGIVKCYKCGDIGHFSKTCPKKVDALLPLEEYNSADDSPFPTLEEAADMAKEIADNVHRKGRKYTFPVEEPTEVIADMEFCISSDIQPLFKLSSDGSVIDTPEEVFAALKDLGHSDFRPGQEKGVMRILSGLSTVVTLSTGSGKSLIYQLPAYMFNKAYPGCITLVISPLVSLMEDQIMCGSKTLRAVCLHHNMTTKKRETVLEALKKRLVSVLLIAPESLSSWDSARSLLKILPPIAFACIDEAHSISQHSHNFRPTYLSICQVLREKLGIKTFLGLTATASVTSLETIMSQLGVSDFSSVISDTPLPDNLYLSVSLEYDKREALLTLLRSERFCGCNSIIVYCTRREECDKIAAFLRTSLQDCSISSKKGRLSIYAEAYHAGLSAGRRNQVQSAFMSGNLRIVVATVAFGMGINKNDIRGIIHYNMPYSFESYVQEIGRAGRDKKPAQCHLFIDDKKNDINELKRHIYADTMDRHTIRKLLQLVFVPCDCGTKISSQCNDENGESPSSLKIENKNIICSKHEVAFPIENTIMSLDLPQEVISTLLAYLELDEGRWIKVLPLAYTKCKVTSYKGPGHLKKIARNCAPLAVILAEQNNLDKATIEFDVVKLARRINWDSGTVKHYLKQLEWITVENKPRKSGISVEFSCLGFRILAPGNLNDAQLDEALDLLHSKVKFQEETRVKQLSLFYDSLKKVSYDSVNMCCESVDQDKCVTLKTDIRKYFSSTNPTAGVNLCLETIVEEQEVAGDIRRLISQYGSDNSFTGRNIARILHGIGSPLYPPIVWGRTKFWRLHLNQDFNSLAALANKQLILMR